MTTPPPDAIYLRYLDVVRRAVASDGVFQLFKGHPDYRAVLEHVTEEQGRGYLDVIRRHDVKVPDSAWESALVNDSLGTPACALFDLPIGARFVSPTTLRYFKYALDVVAHVRRCGLVRPLRVVEIGPGYSGFCTVFLAICKSLEVAVERYTMLDLEPVARLCNRVQDRIAPTNCFTWATTLDRLDSATFDLVLSFYCYSELGPEWRALYRDAIVAKAPHGLMAWNYIPREQIAAELGRADHACVPEVPLTGGANCIVRW